MSLLVIIEEAFIWSCHESIGHEKGPDHNKCFELEAVVDGRHFKSAWGNNKKDAEQKAALNALVELGITELPQETEEE